MIERGYGRIVNIASLNTFVSLRKAPPMPVNAITPGVFRIALNVDLLDQSERSRELRMRTPMNRFGHTEEVVGGVVHIASDATSFVTGENLVIDGGFLASGVNQ